MRALRTIEQHTPTRSRYARLALVDAAVPYSAAHGVGADVDMKTQVTYTWDDFGRKLKETDPLNKFWRFEYDQNNNLTKSTDAKGQVTQFAYGDRGLLLTRTDAAGKKTAYTYNALGQVLTAQNPEVTYSHAYDSAHRLASITDSRGGKKLSYAYSPGGLLNTQRDNEGRRTDYLYDAVGRLSGIWAPNDDYVAYVYDPAGRLTEKWFPNGVNAQYTWNTDSTLAKVSNRFNYSDTFVISQHEYSYNGVGQRKDALEKLGVYAPPAINDTYGYDELGNRVKSTGAASLFFVTDAANQLLEVHSGSIAGPLTQAYVYDDNGNMTQKCVDGTVTRSATTCSGASVTSLTYNALDQLAQVNKVGQVSQYAYDDAGRRIKKTVNGVTTNYLYNGPDIQAEYQTWSKANVSYTHGPNTDDPAIRVNAANDANYFHQDGLGSVVATTDASGNLTAAQLYDAWGKPHATASLGSLGQYGYTGREPDETGMMYYRARYYDPSIGRFTQRDPIGLNGGINQYAYVGNDPVNYTDPSGEIALNAAGAIWGGVSGALSGGISGWMTAAPNASFSEKFRNAAIGGTVGGAVGAVAGALLQPHMASVLAIQATAGVIGAITANPATTAITQGLDGKRVQPFENFTGAKLAPAVIGAVLGPAAVGAARIGAALANSTIAAAGSLAGGAATRLIPIGSSAFANGESVLSGVMSGIAEGSLAASASGKQTLPAFVTPDPTAGGLFTNPDTLCITCLNNYNSGGFSNQGGKLKF